MSKDVQLISIILTIETKITCIFTITLARDTFNEIKKKYDLIANFGRSFIQGVQNVYISLYFINILTTHLFGRINSMANNYQIEV